MTTGKRVLYVYAGAEICISTDSGHYEGTNPEYNVRKLSDTVTLKNLDWQTPLVDSIRATIEGYGMGHGPTSKLYPITAEQEAELIAINHAAEETEEARKEANRQASKKDRQQQLANGFCPKCGTYCHGDCDS